jgi:hypothetical protein
VKVCNRNGNAGGFAFGDLHGNIPAQRADPALEVPHAGLTGLVANDCAQCVVAELLIGAQY